MFFYSSNITLTYYGLIWKTLSQKSSGIYHMSDLFFFFPVIAIFDATLFCGKFDSSIFAQLLWVNGTFPLLFCTVIKLRNRITYGNFKSVITKKQSFRTTWQCYLQYWVYCDFRFRISLITDNILYVHLYSLFLIS